jgi:murein DD-endopeptidase MepM/ murein hydrolase activator NlpD
VVSEIKVARVAPRSTLATTLGQMGLSNNDVTAVLDAMRPIFDFRKSRIGDQIRTTSKDGKLELVEYRSSPLNEWFVERDGDKLVGKKREIEIEKKVATVDIAIGTSLYDAMIAAGEDPSLAVDVADVLAWDVDFYRDVRRGDRLRVVVEKELSRGKTLRYGTILGARYEGELTGSKRFLRYTPVSGDPSYFDEKGNAAKRAFLKSPLKYVHITSGFGGRKHPLLGYQQQHQGVDFAAAIGTPVWAVADGTVTRVVHGDPGGGNFVFVRHSNGFETGYLHLSQFGEGVHIGARVRQKQIIAFSGNTGMSTGPHLHFAMKRNGSYVNPLGQKFPHAEPLPKNELPRFMEQTADIAQMLNAEIVAELAPSAPSEVGTP